ncbi:MAG: hypothetical protein HOE90_21625 [Bacteriovoracaceae bacterium]|jgi:hypothetical protein|nr:hypothetical protein [Bacteriovoracaceae bacterium]
MKRHLFLKLAGTSALLAASMSLFAEDQSLNSQWQDLCSRGGAIERYSAVIPKPNYENEEIAAAAAKLSQIVPDSFYMYSDIQKVYGLCYGSKKKKGKCKPEQIEGKPEAVTVDAHNFLTILCAEFRDDLAMLKSKLGWAERITVVPDMEQTYDPAKGVWEQVTGEGYHELVEFSEELYRERLGQTENTTSSLTLEQDSVKAVTTCEYRFMLKNYLSTDEYLDLPTYESNLSAFFAGTECSDDEKNHYNEFRGDGNYKPQSLESNAFIWNTRVYAKNCSTPTTAKPKSILTDADCEGYFTMPFKTRYNLAKAGLYRLFFYPSKYNDLMKDYKRSLVFVTDDVNKDGIADMIVLDKSLQGEGETVEDKGADTVAKLRNKVQTMRKNGQYAISNQYSTIMHYVTLKASIAQLKEIGEDAEELEAVMKRAEKPLYNQLTKWERSNVATEKQIEKLKAQVDPENADWELQTKISKLERKIGNVNDDKELLTEILIADEFKGVVLVTDVMDGWNATMKEEQDNGFYKIFSEREIAWDRIATVLDRHTDWYQIDMLNLKLGFYQPTFSPWVASSYYINKSDAFTKPGYAMGMAGDGHRHWMFIQKVSTKSWYKASDMRGGSSFDLLNTWFDETTFSRSHLGADEQGWDRFGTAKDTEMGENLYLYNIGSGY